MTLLNRSWLWTSSLCIAMLAALLFAGCDKTAPNAKAEMKPAAQARPTIRIRAGVEDTTPFKDSAGNVWLPDQGFLDGQTIDRPDVTVANTKDPAIYHAERYGMTGYSIPVPNGKYTVKLHFSENYDGNVGPKSRVFSFKVGDAPEVKDFDLWTESGGAQKALVKTFTVNVTNGKLDITFTPNIENPQINGIEIIPA